MSSWNMMVIKNPPQGRGGLRSDFPFEKGYTLLSTCWAEDKGMVVNDFPIRRIFGKTSYVTASSRNSVNTEKTVSFAPEHD